MQLLSGKPIAERVLADTKWLIEVHQLNPGLAIVMVGSDPASEIYVGLKEKAARLVGVRCEQYVLPLTSETETVQALIRELNNRSDIHGIIVQLPLPETFDTDQIIATIIPEKDADGFHPETVADFLALRTSVPPVFPRAVLALLESAGVILRGKRALIFANSSLFSRVMERTLESIGVTAESCLRWGESQIKKQVVEYDIVISAKGDPNFLTGDMVRSGAIVIDGGITRVGEKVVSDTEQVTFEPVDGFITPVPGGVGPVTVAYLISRVTELAFDEYKRKSIL